MTDRRENGKEIVGVCVCVRERKRERANECGWPLWFLKLFFYDFECQVPFPSKNLIQI